MYYSCIPISLPFYSLLFFFFFSPSFYGVLSLPKVGPINGGESQRTKKKKSNKGNPIRESSLFYLISIFLLAKDHTRSRGGQSKK
jgi:hypothetical protein